MSLSNSIIRRSGGASYGSKGLKPPEFSLKPPPPDFCVKWCFHQWLLSLSAITEGLHLTVNCKKTRLVAGALPGPAGGAYSAPQTPIAGFKGYGLSTRYAVSAFGAD